jgi:hypothetical protein
LAAEQVGNIIMATLRETRFSRNPILASDSAGLFWYGIDVVSALDSGAKEFGYLAYSVSWGGAIWLFRTPEHLNAFMANPRRYLPEYGGHCAECMVQGHLEVSGGSFRVRDGKLYLFVDEGLAHQWESHSSATIESANMRWRRLRSSQFVPAGSNSTTGYLRPRSEPAP